MNIDDLTEEEMDALAEEGTEEEKRAIAMHPNASIEALYSLAQQGFADYVDKNPLLIFHEESGSFRAPQIISMIAIQTEDVDRLVELSAHNSKDVRHAVACNSRTPKQIIALLSKDSDNFVRAGVAMNESAPPKILSLLAKDRDPNVRFHIATNANTPVDVLSRLAKDRDGHVRRKIASNERTPRVELSILAKDQDDNVRYGVAGNVNTPQSALKKLVEDPSRPVMVAALNNFSRIR